MSVIGPIEQIHLTVRDIAAAKAFYAGKLKLKMVAAGDDLAIFDTGQAKLILAKGDGAAKGVEFGFTVESLEAAIAELIAADVRIAAPPKTEEWGGRVARIADPDGNTLSLVQYP
ncbi:MAG: VOC family protein [Proteobacteria bacterium]|nr:VOC family protein [Pseudomonadota bacterium]